jgi:cell division septation protein DedD
MRWAAMAIMAVILITGCRKQEKDVEALSREAVEDEVTAVLDSLERASVTLHRDTTPITQAPGFDTAAPSAVESAGGESASTPMPFQAEPVAVDTPGFESAEAPGQGKVGWVIQIGTYGEYTTALEMADKYKRLDLPAFVRRVDKDGRTFYRLRLGVYDSYQQAYDVGKQLKNRYSLNYWIARNQ